MATLVLPDVPRKKMDAATLAALLSSAFKEVLIAARKLNPPLEPFSVWRTTAGGSHDEVLQRPSVLKTILEAVIGSMAAPACRALIDYVWQHGGQPLEVTRDNGQPPGRDAWEPMCVNVLLAFPLSRLLEDASVRALHATGQWNDWAVSDSAIELTARWTAEGEINDGAWIRATVPLLNVTLLPGVQEIELEPGIWLRDWTSADSAAYVHTAKQRLESSEAPRMMFGTMSQVEFALPMIDPRPGGRLDHSGFQRGAQDLLSRVMVRVKWALMVAAPAQDVPIEMPPSIESFGSMMGFFPIRRQAALHRWGGMHIDADAAVRAKQLLAALAAAERRFSDLESALWLLDRSILAELSRDVLLDAAIGLERILVPESGENTRRFKQYGAALMGDSALVGVLGKIYQERSTVAHHGIPSNKDKIDMYAPLARRYLAKCIERVTAWVAAGYLGGGSSKLNKAIEDYLVDKMCAAPVPPNSQEKKS